MTSPVCRVVQDDGVAVAHLRGEIDVMNVPLITGQMRDGARDSAVGLAVDLTDVRYLDSAGMQMLFHLAQELSVARKGMAVALPDTSPITRLLSITHFQATAKVLPTLAECLDSLRSRDFQQY